MSAVKGKHSILSMTAYAVIERSFGRKTYKLHLKTVNHRFTEIRVRMPRSLTSLETEVRTLLPKRVQRGSCDFWMEEHFPQGKPVATGSAVKNFFEQLGRAMKESKEVGGLGLTPAPVRALLLVRFPQLWLNEETVEETPDREIFLAALEELCEQLESSRKVEGQTVADALTELIDEIDSCKTTIAAQLPTLRAEWEKNLRERVHKLSQDAGVAPPNEERLLQELLFLGEKRDIAEEIQRISAHVAAIRESVATPPNNFGRRLEFLLQELHREWTTLGNKIQNVESSRKVVDAKLTLEKMREQSLNLV